MPRSAPHPSARSHSTETLSPAKPYRQSGTRSIAVSGMVYRAAGAPDARRALILPERRPVDGRRDGVASRPDGLLWSGPTWNGAVLPMVKLCRAKTSHGVDAFPSSNPQDRPLMSTPPAQHKIADERYWQRRSGLLYYKYLNSIVRDIGASAQSIVDVGTGHLPYLEWFDWIPEKVAVDLLPPYSSETVKGISGDIFELSFPKKFDLCTCMQVIEHVPDAGRFARRLMEIAHVVLVSVPHKWPAGAMHGHVHDPVTPRQGDGMVRPRAQLSADRARAVSVAHGRAPVGSLRRREPGPSLPRDQGPYRLALVGSSTPSRRLRICRRLARPVRHPRSCRSFRSATDLRHR